MMLRLSCLVLLMISLYTWLTKLHIGSDLVTGQESRQKKFFHPYDYDNHLGCKERECTLLRGK